MRLFVVIITLLFSISLADANQQALLRVQWQQLALQNGVLSFNEKLERIQALSSLITVKNGRSTHVKQSPSEVFNSGLASQAEVAFAKWSMFKGLGFPTDEFRLVYVKDKADKSTKVWLAWYADDQIKLITTEDVIERQHVIRRMQSSVDVISVINPKQIFESRTQSRASGQSQESFII